MTHRLMKAITAWTAAALACFVAVSAGIAAPTGSGSAGTTTAVPERRAEQIGTDAYVYGIALMEFVRQARTQTSVTVPNTLSDAPVNQFGHARQLASASRQVFVQPNLDTLYSMAHLDLSRGPLVLHVAAVPNHRYYEIQFLDPYTNVFHYVGTRSSGDGAGTYVITGPSFGGRLPHGLRHISSEYEHVWLCGRTAVYGPHDLGEVHRIQDGFRLVPLNQYRRHGLSWRAPRPGRIITKHTAYVIPTGLAFFDALGTALGENPPPAADAPILRELRTVGIGPGLHPSSEKLSAAIRAGLTTAADAGPSTIFALRPIVGAKSALAHDGWFVPPADTGAYGSNYKWRAVVAVNGLAANRPAEAIYTIGTLDTTHAFLVGGHSYVIHFAAGQLPPARYFWSLTIYDQNFYLVHNAINRYSLGEYTAGLKRNPDGSLDFYLQPTAPVAHESNWLPTPANGKFEATLRIYGPLPIALNGSYVYPPITRTS